MKSLFAALSLVFVTAACSSANDTTEVKGASEASKRVLFPIEGTISSVQAKSADAPALGLWTEVEVEYLIPCTNKLESSVISYDRTDDGKIKILASAFASASKKTGEMVCQAFSHHTETVSIPGIVAQEDIQLVNLTAPRADIPATTMAVLSSQKVEILSTRSLCPAGATCIQNGTVVTLGIELSSCVNTLGPVAIHADQAVVNGSLSPLKLAVHAIDFQDESSVLVRCARTVVEKTISLPMLFGDEKSIQLQVLQ